MTKLVGIYLIVFILFSSCTEKSHTIYIKMPKNNIIDEKYKVNIKHRGSIIGEVNDKNELNNGVLLLIASIRNSIQEKFTRAIYREDLLGNTYIELISVSGGDLTSNNAYLDTLPGVYAPLYHELDSAKKSELLKELGKFKSKLDSLVESKATGKQEAE